MEKLQRMSQLSRADSEKLKSITGSSGAGAYIKNKKIIIAVLIALLLLAILACVLNFQKKTYRTESYVAASGTSAGLQATITYEARCDKSPCDKKPAFDFNVYLLDAADGQQVGVVRPNQNGEVDVALPQGTYIMLIGKQFGKDKTFPEEKITLKDGQALKLTLHY